MNLWHLLQGGPISTTPGQPDPKAKAKGSGLFRAISRLDGFISVDTPYEGGTLTTPPLIFEGNQLALKHRHKRRRYFFAAEIRSADGKPIEGYTLAGF